MPDRQTAAALQIEKDIGSNLILIVQGKWDENLKKVADFRERLGDKGMATASPITKDKHPAGFSAGNYAVDIALDKQTLRNDKFSAVHALLEGIVKDLGLEEPALSFSRGNVYAQVIKVAGLAPNEYSAAFNHSQADVEKDIFASKNPGDDINPMVGMFGLNGSVVREKTPPEIFKSQPETPSPDYSTSTRHPSDTRITVKPEYGIAHIAYDFWSGTSSHQDQEYDSKAVKDFVGNVPKGLVVLPHNHPHGRFVQSPYAVVFETTSPWQTSMLADLLEKRKNISPEKAQEIRLSVPKGFLYKALEAVHLSNTMYGLYYKAHAALHRPKDTRETTSITVQKTYG